jgi:hypothetical protein
LCFSTAFLLMLLVENLHQNLHKFSEPTLLLNPVQDMFDIILANLDFACFLYRAIHSRCVCQLLWGRDWSPPLGIAS